MICQQVSGNTLRSSSSLQLDCQIKSTYSSDTICSLQFNAMLLPFYLFLTAYAFPSISFREEQGRHPDLSPALLIPGKSQIPAGSSQPQFYFLSRQLPFPG